MENLTVASQLKKADGIGGVTQVVEHLPSKLEAVSSNSSIGKKM
jgi:hypothetical protein